MLRTGELWSLSAGGGVAGTGADSSSLDDDEEEAGRLLFVRVLMDVLSRRREVTVDEGGTKELTVDAPTPTPTPPRARLNVAFVRAPSSLGMGRGKKTWALRRERFWVRGVAYHACVDEKR